MTFDQSLDDRTPVIGGIGRLDQDDRCSSSEKDRGSTMFGWEVVAFDSKGSLAVADPGPVGSCWGNGREVGQTVVEVVLVVVEVLRPEHRGPGRGYGGVQSLELIGLGRREWEVNDPSIYLLLPMPCC